MLVSVSQTLPQVGKLSRSELTILGVAPRNSGKGVLNAFHLASVLHTATVLLSTPLLVYYPFSWPYRIVWYFQKGPLYEYPSTQQRGPTSSWNQRIQPPQLSSHPLFSIARDNPVQSPFPIESLLPQCESGRLPRPHLPESE